MPKSLRKKTISDKDYILLRNSLNLLGYRTYKDFLESNLWKELRLRLKIKSNGKCKICNKHNVLIPHHLSYNQLLNPLNIVLICNECHSSIHDEIAEFNGKISIAKITNQAQKKNKPLPTLSTVRFSLIAFNGNDGYVINNPLEFEEKWRERKRTKKFRYAEVFDQNTVELRKLIIKLINKHRVK